MKILVVDDDKTFLLLAQKTLNGNGHEIEVTTSAMEALLKLLENQDLYDLLITDIQMPLMDGLTLQSKIKATNQQIKIIGVSGHNLNNEEKKAFDYFIEKPFKLNDFRSTVKKALEPAIEHA
jgi:CheY-like chemotaxis protein